MALDFRLKTEGTLRQLIAEFNIFYASGHGIKMVLETGKQE